MKKINLAVSLLVCLVSLQWVQAKTVETLAIGASAPDFSLPGADGKTYSLADFKNANILAIVFTCNHCPTAQSYGKRIQQIFDDYKEKGVALVAISPNDPLAVRLDELGFTDLGDSFEDMKIRVKDEKITYPYLYDGDKQAVASQYGPVSTPHVFIFDKERKLRYCGRIDNNEKQGKSTTQETRDAIEALLAGKPVKVETTKTFGCSIKWADKREGVKQAFEAWAKEPVELKDLNAEGLKTLLENKTDKYLLINVWATWCGSCVTEFPEFVTLNRMYRNREFQMVSISTDTMAKKDKALQFLQKQQASFTNYIFSESDVYKLFEIAGKKSRGAIPLTLFIKPGGDVISTIEDTINPQDLKKTIVEQIGRYYK